jgi:hypothetical protein
MTVILKVNMKSVERDKCLCECYIIIWLCYSQNKYEKSLVRWMFMWMLHHHMTVILKLNMINVEWDECLCECYIIIWLLFSNWIWKMLSEMNVYVNVTSSYDCCSQSEYEKCWVRWMFMWMLHHHMTVIIKMNIWKMLSEMRMSMWMLNPHHHMTVIVKMNMKNVEWDENVYVNVKPTSSYDCCCQNEYENIIICCIWLLLSKWIWNFLNEINVRFM